MKEKDVIRNTLHKKKYIIGICIFILFGMVILLCIFKAENNMERQPKGQIYEKPASFDSGVLYEIGNAVISDYGQEDLSFVEEKGFPELELEFIEELYPDVPEQYLVVLQQYEQLLRTKSDLNKEENYSQQKLSEWGLGYICLEIGWRKNLCYCLRDITGDGFPEMIMGTWYDEGKTVQPYVIYYYCKNTSEIKYLETSSYWTLIIRENAIIELAGGGVYSPVQFEQFQADTEEWESLAHIHLELDNKGEYKRAIFRKHYDDIPKDISLEEYYQIIEQYSTSLVELDWALLKGAEKQLAFWLESA